LNKRGSEDQWKGLLDFNQRRRGEERDERM